MKRAQITFALAALLSTAFLVACGSQKSSTGGQTSLNPNATAAQPKPGQPSKARLKILNAEALQKISVTGETHEFYAVQGQLVERAKVDEMAGKMRDLVACEVKNANFEFQNGDLAAAVTVTPSVDGAVHKVTIMPNTALPQQTAQAQVQVQDPAQNQSQNQSQFQLNSFEIICFKAYSAMTPAEIAGALQGIVLIN